MKLKILYLSIILIIMLSLSSPAFADGEEITIGVLSFDSKGDTIEKW